MNIEVNGVAEGGFSAPDHASERCCDVCGTTIPAARLKAISSATRCVPCLQATGDVDRIRRYDDYSVKDCEDVYENYFTHNPYFEYALSRLRNLGTVADTAYA